MTHLVASISAHGYGHLAITAPVLERLLDEMPAIRITVLSSLPEQALRNRIRRPFETTPDALDFGLRMKPDQHVDIDRTVSDYASLHSDWHGEVARRAAWLSDIGCDLVLANVSYLNVAAAARAGIPAVALAPLNWADLYRYFVPDTAANRLVFGQMADAYNQCRMFLAPEPNMPMPNIDTPETIPPIAQPGRGRRDELDTLYGLDPSTRLLLLALGGHEARMNLDDLPEIEGARWLVEDRWALRRRDILSLDHAGMIFPDLLASSDLLVAKPGYGAFTEAACLGIPVVYLRRPDWPEEDHLIDWLRRRLPCREAPRGDARALEAAIKAVIESPTAPACSSDGAAVCVSRLRSCLSADFSGRTVPEAG